MTTLVDPLVCEHRNRIGDSYGTTCRDCGKQLYGFGYWGVYKSCIHLFAKSNDSTYQVCIFCELEIDRPNGEEAE